MLFIIIIFLYIIWETKTSYHMGKLSHMAISPCSLDFHKIKNDAKKYTVA